MSKKLKPEEQVGFEFDAAHYESPGMQRTQRELTRRAMELSGLEKGRVLDIGCGTGLSTEVLAERFDVVGIDPNEAMVAKARAKSLDCRVGSFEKIPFPDASFDAVVSISALQWADYARAAKEVARVLKKSGKLVIQFYPGSEVAALGAAQAFSKWGFTGRIAIDEPKNPKKRKFYLVLAR